MPTPEEQIDESITLESLSTTNYKFAPTPVLEEFLRGVGTYTASILVQVDHASNIRSFNNFCRSQNFAVKYDFMVNVAKWNRDADELWDFEPQISDTEIQYLLDINRLADAIGVSVKDADFIQRIEQAFRDDLAIKTRQDILREVNKNVKLLKEPKIAKSVSGIVESSNNSSKANDIAALKKEIKDLERFAAPFKDKLALIKKNDTLIDELLAKLGITPKNTAPSTKQDLLAAIRGEAGATRTKAKFSKTNSIDEVDKLIQQLADLHAIIALINSGNVQGMLTTQIASQETVIQTLNASLAPSVSSTSTAIVNDIERVRPINPKSLLGELITGKDKLKKVADRPKTPIPEEDEDNFSIASSINKRRQRLKEDEDLDDVEDTDDDINFDFDSDYDSQSISSSSRSNTPAPVTDQLDSVLLSESSRELRLEKLNNILSQRKILVEEKDINAFFAKVLLEREQVMQKHAENMATAIAKRKEAAEKPRLDQKKTHLFTNKSKEAASNVGSSLEDDQVRNHMKQVLRDINKSVDASEKMLDAVVQADPTKSDEMEVQREQLRDIRAGIKNPLFEWDLDEDHDGNALLEQVTQLTDLASNSYGVCESISNAAKKTKNAIGSAFTTIRDVAWGAIKLVVNGVMKLIDMVAGLFKRRKYDESAFGPVQNAADMLAYKAKDINTRSF